VNVARSSLWPLLALFIASTTWAAEGNYATIGPLKMYYEIHGAAHAKTPPLVLIHGGGSTIESFAALLPGLAKSRRVIAVEEQAHGRSSDVPGRALSFEQTADDIAALLAQLKIAKADVCGFSNGGHHAMQLAIRHPQLVRKLIVISSPVKRDGFVPHFFESMPAATLDTMPAELKEQQLKVNPDPAALRTMFEKDRQRMIDFKDWPDDSLRAIQAPTLLIVGDRDVIVPEHAVAMFRLLPHAQLAVLPDTDHMKMLERPDPLLALLPNFLDGGGGGDRREGEAPAEPVVPSQIKNGSAGASPSR
jgi:pimeloyl-ACP methyl ester carboxylesterase